MEVVGAGVREDSAPDLDLAREDVKVAKSKNGRPGWEGWNGPFNNFFLGAGGLLRHPLRAPQVREHVDMNVSMKSESVVGAGVNGAPRIREKTPP